jgi:ATP-dependent exoDNAse (exonuclease V) alpha subunit
LNRALAPLAIYFLNLKTFGRSGGSSAVSAAAYRAGERIRDERTGKTYDHVGRQDVMHKEIILPGEFAADAMDWAQDRANLWNTAEGAETRKNARVAREYLVALPAELPHEHRLSLVRGFSHELVERYRFALDVAIHAPRDFPGSDPRNFHAHLLATTREVTTDGLGAKTTVEWSDANRREAGLGPAIDELLHVRQRWAEATNAALQEAHLGTRIDHRTLRAQGIDREPTPHIPRAAFEMERHGYRSVVAERIREEYQASVESRLQRSAQLHSSTPAHSAAEQSPAAAEPKSMEETRRQAAEHWLRWRETQPKPSAAELQRQSIENWRRWREAQAQPEPSKGHAATRTRDDDHSL